VTGPSGYCSQGCHGYLHALLEVDISAPPSLRHICLGTVGLIVAPWKLNFDVLKTSIHVFALKALLLV